MASLADLHRAVAATLATRRIGQPVFVRYLLHTGEGTANPAVFAEHIGATLREWFGQSFECRHTSGSEQTGPVSFCFQSDSGALAFVNLAPSAIASQAVDLTLLGTHGAIYHPVEFPPPFEDDDSPGSPPAPTQLLPRYGVLLVSGSQTHQEDYALAFAADSRCRLIAVTDESTIDARRRELNERLAKSLGIPYLPDLNDALQRSDVDIVSICAPPQRRGRIAVRCAEAGKHLYLDKSLAPSLEEALAIVQAAKQSDVRSHMFSFIASPWARRAKRLIENGTLGSLRAIHADTFFAKGHAGTVSRPTTRREEYPPKRHQLIEAKRELDNVGVYPITLVRWLTGRAFANVRAFTANFFFAEHERHNVEDFGMLAATLDDGMPVTIAAGRIGWHSHPASGVNRVVLIGSRRTVTIDANRPRLEIHTDEPPWMPPPAHPDDPMAFWTSTQKEMGMQPKRAWVPVPGPASDASYFLDQLDANRDSEMSATQAAMATEVLLAAYKSAATGETIRLPLQEK